MFHSNHCRVGVKSPGGGVNKFSITVLPFGATGSVVAFLRTAASVSYIALVGLQIIITNFFDDFTVVRRPRMQIGGFLLDWIVSTVRS